MNIPQGPIEGWPGNASIGENFNLLRNTQVFNRKCKCNLIYMNVNLTLLNSLFATQNIIFGTEKPRGEAREASRQEKIETPRQGADPFAKGAVGSEPGHAQARRFSGCGALGTRAIHSRADDLRKKSARLHENFFLQCVTCSSKRDDRQLVWCPTSWCQ